MKITTNAINNYALQAANVTQNRNKIQTTPSGDLSKDEKQFFVELYPKNKTEIMDYHYYKENGKMSGVAIGSNIDRRG